MARRTLQVEIFPATGGLQTANNPAIISPNNLSDANNIYFSVDNTRKTRPALKTFSAEVSEVENVQFLFDFWRLNGSGSQTNKVIKIINGKFEADTGGDGSFIDYTNGHTILATDVVTGDVFSGILMTAYENAYPKKFDHSSLLNLGGSPRQGSLIRTHFSCAWLAGIKSDPHALDRSGFDNPEDWTSADTETIYIDDGDGDPDGITALFPSFYGDLYVAKRKSIYRIRPQYDSNGVFYAFSKELFLRGVGCIAHNSVVAIQNDIIFVSERGVHSLISTQKYGDAESTFLSAPIQDVFKYDVDFSRGNQITAAYLPEWNSYVMSLPIKGASYNRDVYGYNVLTGQWYRFLDINIAKLCTFVDSNKKTRLLACTKDGVVGYFDEDESLDFGSDAINSSFKTGIIYAIGAKRSVSFKSLTCIYVPQGDSTFDVSYSIDGQQIDTVVFDQSGGAQDNLGEDFILGVSSLGAAGTVKIETKILRGNGRGIQLTFNRSPSGDDIDQGFEVLGYMIEFMDSETSDQSTSQ